MDSILITGALFTRFWTHKDTDHGLHSSASPTLMATDLVNEKGQNMAPTELIPLTDRQKVVTVTTSATPYTCAKFGANTSTGSLWQMGEI